MLYLFILSVGPYFTYYSWTAKQFQEIVVLNDLIEKHFFYKVVSGVEDFLVPFEVPFLHLYFVMNLKGILCPEKMFE